MTGYTGTVVPIAGDIFIFKRGETWTSGCFPWSINWSGTSGNVITFTSSASWFSGLDPTAKPVFDAGGLAPAGGMVQSTNRSYLLFSYLKFTNYGTSGNEGLGSTRINAIDFVGASNLTFDNIDGTVYTQRMFYVHWNSAGTYSNFTFTNIDCANAASMLWFASSVSVARQNLTIKYCHVHDGASQIGWDGGGGDGTHSDGILHTFGAGTTTGLDIGYNRVSGDFRRSFGTKGAVTNFCYLENGGSGKFYNNLIAPSPTNASYAESWFGGAINSGDNLEVYNNIVWATGTNPASGGILFYLNAGSTLTLNNNIVQGFTYALNFQAFAGTLFSDNNTIVSGSNSIYNGSFRTYAQWQGSGYDLNSSLGTAATFVSAPSNMFHAVGSNSIGGGVDRSSKFTDGILSGATWPAPSLGTRQTPWDRGPYVYNPVPTTPFRLGFRITQV